MKVEPIIEDQEKIGEIIESLKFNKDGLVPAVVQDAESRDVLMVAYMNKESLKRSLQTGKTWFYSRSRNCLWLKGETSGNYQYIREVWVDCDNDTLLLLVDQQGVACHTGARSCFYRCLGKAKNSSDLSRVIDELYEVIKERKRVMPEGSYTAKLFRKGIDKIAQKVGEEAVEVVIAGKNRDQKELIEETADLIYHLLVLLAECGVQPNEVRAKLAERRR
ncbi:MAG: Histidine biosynthesis bifunctional protein HisIE [Thermoanaerobacterales bacterium 50_218]|nr:MAG: Histidine biosynthesis bifunctional protein HisIE [Thermoanaerobacterales bacterium 50_218]HAA90722.1 bifunctional phosphoribosyl-AMP cyclohydrolase/phosphoribosyl-ATP pyrophosphatase [Peptococcaceae bacterium]